MLIRGALNYPRGAPLDACDTLSPSLTEHGPSKADLSSPPPFQIIPSTDSYSEGEHLKIQIIGGNYKGFLLQARSMFTDERVGEFIDPPSGTKLLNCSGGNSITHDGSKESLQGLQYTWIAPGMNAGTINFM
ncbi:unnamed protein product [Gordionus sp. m RMFG-2023]|uniref:putative ferric-chelate reductase 1 n=1 Tax=Gordionus sp. m RMFG-2023 TaxID=3053472 RepID=UPI0030E24201